jgi:hypothetical protein
MEPIRYQETVTEKGLFINGPELLRFIDQKVDITILPIYADESSDKEDKYAWKKLRGKYKGTFTNFSEQRQQDRDLENEIDSRIRC